MTATSGREGGGNCDGAWHTRSTCKSGIGTPKDLTAKDAKVANGRNMNDGAQPDRKYFLFYPDLFFASFASFAVKVFPSLP
jgi:hypothetical protein